MTGLDLAAIEARDAAATLDSLFPVYADRRALLVEVRELRAKIEAGRETVNDLQAFGLIRATDADQLLEALKGDPS